MTNKYQKLKRLMPELVSLRDKDIEQSEMIVNLQ